MKKDKEIRRSSRLTTKTEETTSILKKRTREEAAEDDQNDRQSNKSGSEKAQEAKPNKKPRHQRVTVTGGSLANPSFTHVLSEANQTQKVSDWQ